MKKSGDLRQKIKKVKCTVAECIPRLDLSTISSSSNSIKLVSNLSYFGFPIAVMEGFEWRNSSNDNQDGCYGL